MGIKRMQREQHDVYWEAERRAYYDEQLVSQLEDERAELEYEQTLIGEDGYCGRWTQSTIKEQLRSIEKQIQELRASALVGGEKK